MEIRSCIDRYSPLNWHLRYRVMVVLVFALVLAPAAIGAASDVFSDVPDNNFAHNAINAIFGARITAGVSPGIYNPSGNVTREQMAAFLHRGLPRVAYNELPTTTLSGATDLGAVTIKTGGAPGGMGFVKLDASFFAYTSDATGCPCNVEFYMTQDGSQTFGKSGFETIYNAPLVSYVDGSLTWVVPVPTDSTLTFHLRAYKNYGTATVQGSGALTALYVPFGSTGGNTL